MCFICSPSFLGEFFGLEDSFYDYDVDNIHDLYHALDNIFSVLDRYVIKAERNGFSQLWGYKASFIELT